MLPLLNHSVALGIALAYILLFLCGPFLLAWYAWRIARDLRRIADAAQHTANRFDMLTHGAMTLQPEQTRQYIARVVNSMFGR